MEIRSSRCMARFTPNMILWRVDFPPRGEICEHNICGKGGARKIEF